MPDPLVNSAAAPGGQANAPDPADALEPTVILPPRPRDSSQGPARAAETPVPEAWIPAAAPAAAPAATPQVDMRRVLGTPRPGDVIDTILRSATASALPSKSEGQYIVIQDADGTPLQAHVHGAWAAHPTRIAEGIQRRPYGPTRVQHVVDQHHDRVVDGAWDLAATDLARRVAA